MYNVMVVYRINGLIFLIMLFFLVIGIKMEMINGINVV